MENRRKRWYDLFGLLPRNLGRVLLWLSIIPISFIVILIIYAWRADQYNLDEVLQAAGTLPRLCPERPVDRHPDGPRPRLRSAP